MNLPWESEPESDGNVEEITPVDRQQVFARLEKILATVKLQPVVIPETSGASGLRNS